MFGSWRSVLAVAFLLCLASAVATGKGIKFAMPSKGAVGVYIGSINSAGDVSGSYVTQGGRLGHAYGFIRLADGTETRIDVPNSYHHNTSAGPIDDDGDVTGFYETADKGFTDHAFLRTPDGTITTFDGPGAYETDPYDINAGIIVGDYLSDARHGFMRSVDGTISTIDYPGADGTYAYSLNSSGQIAGTYFDNAGTLHGFVRESGGSFTVIDPPNSVYTDSLRINDKGEVTGIYQNGSGGKYYGFLLTGGKFYRFGYYFSRMNSRNESAGQDFLLKFRDGRFHASLVAPPPKCYSLFLVGINNSSLMAGAMQCGKPGVGYGYLRQK